MSNGADQLTSATVSSASADDVRQRFTDLARRVLRAPVGMLFDQNADGGVRCVSSDVGLDEAARFENRLDAELNDPASGASIGTLIIADIESRRWSEDDRAILREIADSVSMLLGAGRRQTRTDSMNPHEDSTDATTPNRVRALPFVDGNHDLRTSLQGIVGLTELLKERGATRNDRRAFRNDSIRRRRAHVAGQLVARRPSRHDQRRGKRVEHRRRPHARSRRGGKRPHPPRGRPRPQSEADLRHALARRPYRRQRRPTAPRR